MAPITARAGNLVVDNDKNAWQSIHSGSYKMNHLIPCPDFKLLGVDGYYHTLRSFDNAKILVVLFLSNSCPYVDALENRILNLSKKYSDDTVTFVAICSNSGNFNEKNSFDNIKKRWRYKNYPFPYLYDESQKVAKEFNAVCTPDIFVYDKARILRYHGRFDNNWSNESLVTKKYVETAIQSILEDNPVNTDQPISIGCAIKWNTIENDIADLKYKLSAHIRRLRHPSQILLINGTNGVIYEGNEDLVKFLKMFVFPSTIQECRMQIETSENIFDIVSELVDSKYLIVENDTSDETFIEERAKRARKVKSGALLSILRLNLTECCNFRCIYCYMEANSVNRSKTNNGAMMSINVAKNSIDVFCNNALENGRRKITIRYIGGEPLLNKDVLLQSMIYAEKLCKANGLAVTHLLCTNGVLIDEDTLQCLKRLNDVHVMVSLDGLRDNNDALRYYADGSGTHDDIITSIKKLLSNKINIGVPTVLNKTNIFEIFNFVSEIRSLGVSRIGINPEYNFGEWAFEEKSLSLLLDHLNIYRNICLEEGIELNGKAYLTEQNVINGHFAYCEGMGRSLVVDPDGSISCCDKFPEKLGHIDDLPTFLTSETYYAFSMRVRGNIVACMDCEIKWFCNGGCAAEIYSSGGDFSKDKSPNCEFMKAMYEMAFDQL